MERGENGGMVLDGDDGPGDGTDDNAGGTDDAALANIEEIDAAESQPAGKANLDGGTADPKAGEDGAGEEGAADPDGQESGEKVNPELSALRAELKEIRDKVAAPPAQAPKEYTEEDWSKMEQSWGVPRTTIQEVTNQNVKVVQHLTSYIDAKLAKLEFNETLSEFAKQPGFNDAPRYKKEVNDFLSAYEPKHWSNPELIKRAVYYARGVNADKNINAARNNQERNRVIAGKARPSSPSGGTRRTAMPPLTASQREAASLMEGGEAEYNKFKRNGRVAIES